MPEKYSRAWWVAIVRIILDYVAWGVLYYMVALKADGRVQCECRGRKGTQSSLFTATTALTCHFFFSNRKQTDDWFTAFSPFWISAGIDVLLECIACTDPAEDENATRRSVRQTRFSSSIFVGGLGALSVYFCALKFAHPGAVSSFAIFSPLFAIAGCCCCVLSLVVLCVDVEQDGSGGGGGGGGGSSGGGGGAGSRKKDDGGGTTVNVPPPAPTASDLEEGNIADMD